VVVQWNHLKSVGPLPSFPFTVDSFALELPIFCPELESRIQKAAAVPSCVIRAALCGWTINSAKSQKRYHFPPPPGTKLFPLFHLRSSLTPAEPQVFLHICVTVAVSGHQLGHLRMCKTPPALLLSTFPPDHFLFGFISRLNWISLPQLGSTLRTENPWATER